MAVSLSKPFPRARKRFHLDRTFIRHLILFTVELSLLINWTCGLRRNTESNKRLHNDTRLLFNTEFKVPPNFIHDCSKP